MKNKLPQVKILYLNGEKYIVITWLCKGSHKWKETKHSIMTLSRKYIIEKKSRNKKRKEKVCKIWKNHNKGTKYTRNTKMEWKGKRNCSKIYCQKDLTIQNQSVSNRNKEKRIENGQNKGKTFIIKYSKELNIHGSTLFKWC